MSKKEESLFTIRIWHKLDEDDTRPSGLLEAPAELPITLVSETGMLGPQVARILKSAGVPTTDVKSIAIHRYPTRVKNLPWTVRVGRAGRRSTEIVDSLGKVRATLDGYNESSIAGAQGLLDIVNKSKGLQPVNKQ